MNLKRFLTYFARMVSSSPEQTQIRFAVGGKSLSVSTVEFDVASNVWTVQLSGAKVEN